MAPILTPEYDGPILDPCPSNQQTCIGGVVSADCVANTGNQASIGLSMVDIIPSEAGAAPDMSSTDDLDTTAAPTDNLTVAQASCHHSFASMDISMAAHCASATCTFDASDRPDYAADVAEALARLCKRASEDGQGQSAKQAVTDCQQRHVQTAAEFTLNPPVAAAAADANSTTAADSSQSSDVVHTAMVTSLMSSEVQHAEVDQVLDELLADVSAPLQSVQSSTPADSVATIVSEDLAAMLVALVSSQVQHAAVDPIVDELLDEVAAPFQAVQSSIPAGISGMVSPVVSPTVSLPAKCSEGPEKDLNSGCSESAEDASETISADHMVMADALMTRQVQHAAVDQVLDNLLDEVAAPVQAVQSSMPADTSGRVSPILSPTVSLLGNSFAPQQAASLPAVPALDSNCVSSPTHSQPLPPAATAAKHSSAELVRVVPPSSSTGKENSPVVEASRGVNQDRAVVGTLGKGRDRVCCLDRHTIQQMAQALPTEPSSQVVQLTMVPLH